MNTPTCIWSDLPMAAGIAALVNYAGVFGDVIGVEEVAARLGVSGSEEFYSTLNDLHLRGRLIIRDGYVGLPGLEEKVDPKASKTETTKQLINSHLDCIKKIGRNPLVKFVGISGSLAANNPIRDRKNHLDIDLFLITRSQGLWPYVILRGIRNLLPRSKREQILCPNYILDESNLLIPTRNFYTATEIRNVIPISGLDVYRKFLQVNRWVDYYYPGFSGAAVPVDQPASGHMIRKLFFVLYRILRCIKWRSLDPLREMSFNDDPHRGTGLNVAGIPYGGYQALVQEKFSRLAAKWFPDLLDASLVEKLFPDELSAEIRRGELDVPAIIMKTGLGFDYSKYA